MQLLARANQGNHDFGKWILAFSPQFTGCFKDRLCLHFGNLGIGYAQAAAPVAQHRIEFLQHIDLVTQESPLQHPSLEQAPGFLHRSWAETHEAAGQECEWSLADYP